MLKDSSSYILKKEKDNIRIYIHSNPMELHTTRYVEILNQQIYANAGATKETLQEAIDEILLRCNDMKNQKTFRTDIAAIAQSLQYRLQYPVDQHCAIRIGALCSFYEEDIYDGGKLVKTISENPDKFDGFFQQKKEMIALNDPDWYSFFLTWGIVNTPEYNNRLDTLTDTDYFVKRETIIKSLNPLKQPNS